MTRGKSAPEMEAFLRSHVSSDTDACIDWPFRRDRRGYGFVTIDGVQRRAQNWMCRLAHGEPSTQKLHAAHNCGNSSCINPKHLRWATAKENAADRQIHGTENVGERNGQALLTTEIVLEIRRIKKQGKQGDLTKLAHRCGIDRKTLYNVTGGRSWAHVK